MSIYDKIVETAITFDDVLLVPSYSEVLPNQVSLKSRLSDKITLNVPIVSAAMDTVTEADMAIALARVGGLGFIHKNMPIEEQASQVNQVKRSENGMIANPVTLSKDHTLAEAKALMAQFKISGLPVVDEEHKLIGIITNRDVKYQENLSVKVEELMTKENLIVSNEEVNLEKAKEILLKNRVEKLPIVDKSNKLIGLITIKDIDNQLEYPNANKDKSGRLIVGAGVGIGVDTIERVSALVEAGVDIIAVDSAHGHSKGVLDKIKEIRQNFPDLDIVGGNIVTAEAAEDLIKAGANVLKVGVGPIITGDIILFCCKPFSACYKDSFKITWILLPFRTHNNTVVFIVYTDTVYIWCRIYKFVNFQTHIDFLSGKTVRIIIISVKSMLYNIIV